MRQTLEGFSRNLLKVYIYLTLNLNIEKNETVIKKHLVNFYQDNYATIFRFDETRLDKVKSLYKKYDEKVFAHAYTSEPAKFKKKKFILLYFQPLWFYIYIYIYAIGPIFLYVPFVCLKYRFISFLFW